MTAPQSGSDPAPSSGVKSGRVSVGLPNGWYSDFVDLWERSHAPGIVQFIDYRPEEVSQLECDVLLLDLAGTNSDLYPWQRCPDLKWVHTLSTGVDRLLARVVGDPGWLLTSSAGALSTPMAEFVLAVILSESKEIPELLRRSKERRWERTNLSMEQFQGRSILLIGFGNVGRAVADRAQTLGFAVRAVTANPDRAEATDVELFRPGQLQDLLPVADFVVLCSALTLNNRSLFGSNEFEAMKFGSVFINVARAELIDEQSLATSLRVGKLRSGWLDVVEGEPLESDSTLWSVPNLVITPHVSSFAPGNRKSLLELFAENLDRFLRQDTLRNEVNFERGY